MRFQNFKLIHAERFNYKKITEFINNNSGSVFQEPELNEIVSKYYNTDFYYLVDDPYDFQSICPVHILKNAFILKQYNFKPLYDMPYGGFVGKLHNESNIIRPGFWDHMNYSGIPLFKATFPINDINSKLKQTCTIDLSFSENEIFMNILNSKRRNMIRKALKYNIEVQSYDNIQGLELFWPLLNELHIKLGFDKRCKYEFYRDIVKEFGCIKKAKIFLAFFNHKVISGILLIGNNNYYHYYKGASDHSCDNYGQGELLQWEAIRWVKQQNVKFYDLCGLDKQNLSDIYRFKIGISNNVIPFISYSKVGFGYKIINRFASLL